VALSQRPYGNGYMLCMGFGYPCVLVPELLNLLLVVLYNPGSF
jgi:hypothetical protein